MKITQDHFVEGVARDIISGGGSMPVRRFLVIHFTAGASGKSSINWWKQPGAKGASAHIVIDRDGSITQCRPFNKTAGHAGESSWRDPNTGKSYNGLNSCSIGIELANGGDSYPRKFSDIEPIKAKHKNGGPIKEWESYTPKQLIACFELAKALKERYNLDDIIGHDDIAPSRKVDPGPAFPMGRLREYCGLPEKIKK